MPRLYSLESPLPSSSASADPDAEDIHAPPRLGDYGIWEMTSAGPRFRRFGSLLNRLRRCSGRSSCRGSEDSDVDVSTIWARGARGRGTKVASRTTGEVRPQECVRAWGNEYEMSGGEVMKICTFDLSQGEGLVQVDIAREERLEDESASYYLLLTDGYQLARANGVPLEELVMIQRRKVMFHARADASARPERTRLFFHHRMLDMLDLAASHDEPWGFWSTDREPHQIPRGETIEGVLTKAWTTTRVEYLKFTSVEADVMSKLRKAECNKRALHSGEDIEPGLDILVPCIV